MDHAATLLIVRRELMTVLRSLKSAGLMLLFMVMMTWMAAITMAEESSFSANSAAMRNYFMLQAFALFFVAVAVLPAMAAVSLSGERESGGHDLLATSLIPPASIALGKYLAVLTYFFLFAVAVLPYMGLVYFYAGLDVLEFFDTFVWVLPPVPFCAALGIWVSGRLSRPAHAVLATFAMMIAAAALFIGGGAALVNLASTLQYVNGFQFLWTAISTTTFNMPVLMGLYQGVLAVFFLADSISQYRISGMLVRPRAAWGQKVTTPRESRLKRLYGRLRDGIPLLTVPDRANPFGYRELYGNVLRSPSASTPLFLLTLFLYAGSFSYACTFGNSFADHVGAERLVLLVLLPPLIAIALVRERESTTLDMYRMTARPGAHMLLGKMMGLVRLFRPVFLAMLLTKLVVAFSVTVASIRLDLTGQDVYSSPQFFRHWFDLATLPLHVLLVLCVAVMGGVFPRSPVAAIVAAMVCAMVVVLPTMPMQYQILDRIEAPPTFRIAYMMFFAPLITTFVVSWFAFTIAAARITHIWEPTHVVPR